jgi:hypothetical protein
VKFAIRPTWRSGSRISPIVFPPPAAPPYMQMLAGFEETRSEVRADLTSRRFSSHLLRGTEGSNPVPSSGESPANRVAAGNSGSPKGAVVRRSEMGLGRLSGAAYLTLLARTVRSFAASAGDPNDHPTISSRPQRSLRSREFGPQRSLPAESRASHPNQPRDARVHQSGQIRSEPNPGRHGYPRAERPRSADPEESKSGQPADRRRRGRPFSSCCAIPSAAAAVTSPLTPRSWWQHTAATRVTLAPKPPSCSKASMTSRDAGGGNA